MGARVAKRKSRARQGEVLFNLPLAPPVATQAKIGRVNRAFAGSLFEKYLQLPIKESVSMVRSKSDAFWMREGQKRALQLFYEVSQRVPAYKDFLKRHKITPSKIRSVKDFGSVPWVDKKNYLEKYPLDALSWDGILESNHVISVSSGSSGLPFFWPRGSLMEIEATLCHEVFFQDIFECSKYKTLFVNSFAMGMYIAGPLTFDAVLRNSQKKYPMTVIAPGLEVRDALRAIQDLCSYFDQIVLAGYPPFIKDIVDEGKSEGINWRKKRIRFLLAGEGFNESWREYVAELVGQSNTIMSDFINIYGTADAGLVGHESPTSVAIRRIAASDKKIFSSLFPEERNGRLPTFVHFYPTLKYFEEIDNELFVTATAGIPLVRYNLHDFGGVIPVRTALRKVGMTKRTLATHVSKGYGASRIWNLPFVYLYGKSDYTVTLYGLNIYPENIKLALEGRGIRKQVTGRFTMSTEYRPKSRDQYLLVNVELAKGVRPGNVLHQKLSDALVQALRSANFEFNKLCSSIGDERSAPVIRLYRRSHPKYFNRDVKHRWVIE